jgi:hypothetical protein
MKRLAIVAMLLLTGCASTSLSSYIRTDGLPINTAQEQSALAQCKGEAAMASDGDPLRRAWRKEDAVIAACMARAGYIQPQ